MPFRYTFSTQYFCAYCFQTFPNKEALDVHRNAEHSLGYLCKQAGCGETFQVLCKYYEHESEKHQKRFEFICGRCKKTFFQALSLRLHMVSGCAEGNHLCAEGMCNKKYSSKKALVSHMQHVHNICSKCNVKSPRELSLRSESCANCQEIRKKALALKHRGSQSPVPVLPIRMGCGLIAPKQAHSAVTPVPTPPGGAASTPRAFPRQILPKPSIPMTPPLVMLPPMIPVPPGTAPAVRMTSIPPVTRPSSVGGSMLFNCVWCRRQFFISVSALQEGMYTKCPHCEC